MTETTTAPHAVVLPGGMTAINLCGHAIRLVTADGTVLEWARTPGEPAHAPTTPERRDLGLASEPEVWAVWYGRPVLPDPQPRTVYIVPLVTALLAEGRRDLVVPHGQRRTDDGRLLVTECTGLAYVYPPVPVPVPPVREDQAAGARLYSDVDRCEHGRHYGDVCGSGCAGGVSLGHPATRGGEPATVAYSLDGYRWVAPAGRGHVEYLPPEAASPETGP